MGESSVLKKIKSIAIKKQLTIATAESFTAGRLATQLSLLPGSSAFFKGGWVVYSPLLKTSLLNVNAELIKNQGVVNKEVALQMAINCRVKSGAKIGVSTTGVAGPMSDDFGNDVGLAWVGFSSEKKNIAFNYYYPNLSREEFTQKMLGIALEELVSFLNDF